LAMAARVVGATRRLGASNSSKRCSWLEMISFPPPQQGSRACSSALKGALRWSNGIRMSSGGDNILTAGNEGMQNLYPYRPSVCAAPAARSRPASYASTSRPHLLPRRTVGQARKITTSTSPVPTIKTPPLSSQPPQRFRSFGSITSLSSTFNLASTSPSPPSTVHSVSLPHRGNQQLRYCSHRRNMCRGHDADVHASGMDITKGREILPADVKPLHYHLTLEPNLETFEYVGEVSIE
jgi:hypothetical protein